MSTIETEPDSSGNAVAAIVAIFAIIVLCLGIFFGSRYYQGHNTKVNVNVSVPQAAPSPKAVVTP